MLDSETEKALIRLDWRRERAYRIGLILSKLGAGLSILAAFVNAAYSRPVVVIADIVLCLGCLATTFWTRREPTRSLVWWPFYVSYWLAINITLLETGGVRSPFMGVFLALLFIGGVVIQSVLRASSILMFTLLNFAFWVAADGFIPVEGVYAQPPAYSFLLNTICLGAIGICVYGFLKTEEDLSVEFSSRYRELEATKINLYREESANAAKSSFLANISHEFRTPLGAILGYVELLQNMYEDRTEGQEFLAIIHRNGRHLVHLVDDLLDLSKAEADRLEIDKHAFSLPELLRQVHDSFELVAEKKNLQLQIKFLNPLPETIVTDCSRVKQILLNLIGNAVKFTEGGSISVLVEFLPKSDQAKSEKIRFEIVDTGRGISESEKEKLFKPFSQADATMSRKYGGTGLGLNLSRRLAELLGGELNLSESLPGVGSRFTFTVNIETPQPIHYIAHYSHGPSVSRTGPTNKSVTTTDKLRLSGLQVLVVDDIADNRVLVQRYIQGAGGEVDFAHDGEEGIRKAMTGKFDVVLMDIQMPGMSGLEAATQLRKNHYEKPIVALSAHAMTQDRERSLHAGFNEHLTKPIQRETLIQRLQEMRQSEIGVPGESTNLV